MFNRILQLSRLFFKYLHNVHYLYIWMHFSRTTTKAVTSISNKTIKFYSSYSTAIVTTWLISSKTSKFVKNLPLSLIRLKLTSSSVEIINELSFLEWSWKFNWTVKYILFVIVTEAEYLQNLNRIDKIYYLDNITATI